MSERVRIIAIVCIAVFAFTAITAVPIFAALDALIPIEDLFATLPGAPAPAVEDVALPAPPARDVASPRGPPVS